MTPEHGRSTAMRLLPWALLVALAGGGCSEKKKEFLAGAIDPETFPTMMTRNVETLISDSGFTRYRITTPLWLVYDEAKEPCWVFPDSLMLEKFDKLMMPEATVNCDSARYFRNRELWRLDGHVRIANAAREKFLTSQLFWDQRARKVYSDSFIHIEKADRVIEGYGFVSDEAMTNYTVRNVQGIFPTSGFAPGEARPAAPDSAAAPSQAPSPRRSAAAAPATPSATQAPSPRSTKATLAPASPSHP